MEKETVKMARPIWNLLINPITGFKITERTKDIQREDRNKHERAKRLEIKLKKGKI
jgi:hypothetical protein